MHTKRIIPCLDVNNGRVVKGTNFVNLRDAGDPIEVAKIYDAAGADELVFLDITESSDAREIKADMVRRVAENVFIPFTVGGGIRTVEDFKMILREGADKVAVNSAAIMNPANPVPEIMPDVAKAAGARVVGTGRSDFPNQVNNVVAFPGIFKGALEGRATKITEEMKLAAANAIASLVPDDELSDDNIMPEAFNPKVAEVVAAAVKEHIVK